MILSEYERFGNFPYEITAEVDALAVSLVNAKLQLRITDSNQDAFITALIKTASLFFESFTKKTLITKTYKTYRNIWDFYSLRRCPLQSISSIKYTDEDDDSQTVDSGDYYIIKDNAFSRIGFVDDFDTPSIRNRPQQIEIIFKAGFGDADIDIPLDIQQGLLEHITYMYENRGDCVDDNCSNIAIPNSTKMAYRKYKIQEVGV